MTDVGPLGSYWNVTLDVTTSTFASGRASSFARDFIVYSMLADQVGVPS